MDALIVGGADGLGGKVLPLSDWTVKGKAISGRSTGDRIKFDDDDEDDDDKVTSSKKKRMTSNFKVPDMFKSRAERGSTSSISQRPAIAPKSIARSHKITRGNHMEDDNNDAGADHHRHHRNNNYEDDDDEEVR